MDVKLFLVRLRIEGLREMWCDVCLFMGNVCTEYIHTYVRWFRRILRGIHACMGKCGIVVTNEPTSLDQGVRFLARTRGGGIVFRFLSLFLISFLFI